MEARYSRLGLIGAGKVVFVTSPRGKSAMLLQDVEDLSFSTGIF
jgi:hypothetical protein